LTFNQVPHIEPSKPLPILDGEKEIGWVTSLVVCPQDTPQCVGLGFVKQAWLDSTDPLACLDHSGCRVEVHLNGATSATGVDL